MAFSENSAGNFVYMTSSNLAAVHAFTTRYGGVSGGIYESMNLGQNLGDSPEDVRRNYDILGAALGFNPSRIVFSRQVHKTDVRHVTAADGRAPLIPIPYEADALITAEPGVPLMIFTADCVPILLFDPVGRVVGAVHAGWRGTVRDIAGKAVREMTRYGACRPENIRAAVGPCISKCCYETGRDVADAVHKLLGGEALPYIAPREPVPDSAAADEKFMADLKGLNGFLLERAGLRRDNIDISTECTSCRCDKYWSHRKTRGRRGSQASIILLKGTVN